MNQKDIRPSMPCRAVIAQAAYDELVRLCLAAMPEEACGILVGRFSAADTSDPSAGGDATILQVSGLHPIANISPTPSNRFAFSPEDWIRAHYDMQKNRQSLVGFYHSHPATPPVPSAADREGLPGYVSGISYWIISPDAAGRNVRMQPYWLLDQRFEPLMLAQISV